MTVKCKLCYAFISVAAAMIKLISVVAFLYYWEGNLLMGVVSRLYFVFAVFISVWCSLENRQVGEAF